MFVDETIMQLGEGIAEGGVSWAGSEIFKLLLDEATDQKLETIQRTLDEITRRLSDIDAQLERLGIAIQWASDSQEADDARRQITE